MENGVLDIYKEYYDEERGKNEIFQFGSTKEGEVDGGRCIIDMEQVNEVGEMIGVSWTIAEEEKKRSREIKWVMRAKPLRMCIGIRCLALDRKLPDHFPIVLKDVDLDYGPKPFRIFNIWMDESDFQHVVEEAWKKEVRSLRPDCVFRDRLKNIKACLRVWSKGRFGDHKGKIESLKKEAMRWELEAEKRSLSDGEQKMWLDIRKQWEDKENEYGNMLRQKTRVRWDVEGDENSKFFHSYVKRRNNKSNLRGLMINGVWCEDPNLINEEMARHYKSLFFEGKVTRPVFCCNRLERISADEARVLEKEFNKKEVWDAICRCGRDKAPWPDGFNFKFIKKFCLIGCYYKIIAKMLAERVKRVVGNVVGEVQNAFIKGRHILDGVLIENETMDYFKKTSKRGLIFKVDFEKAYDSINWSFLLTIMNRMRFGGKWVKVYLQSSCMSILVNESPTEEFGLEGGVRQGDPLSPFLFILATNGLNAIVSEVVENSIFRGVKVGANNVTVSHIFFGEWNKENAKLLMCILKCFEEGALGDSRVGEVMGEGKGIGVWRDIIRVGEELEGMGIGFTSSCIGVLGDGNDISFWLDRWVDDQRLCDRFSRLFLLDRFKEGSVRDKGSWVNGLGLHGTISSFCGLSHSFMAVIIALVLEWYFHFTVGIDKILFLVDFIVLDMLEDIKVPLILGRPFLSTAHVKINMFERKITLKVEDDKIVFKSDNHTRVKNVVNTGERVVQPVWDYGKRGNPEILLQDHAVVDSGCSSHMTGNKAYLSDYEDFNGGFVAFGSDPKGGKITGKGKIKTANLDFDDVYFVDELKFNLFSVSQMCDKKNSVLFTESECLILSPSFKLLDESQVVLRAPRKDDVYSLDLKNIVPSGGITCLYANATADESKLWHMRLGHVNFKNINKLVKGHLVRGLPSKVFVNDHTCVACKKGKQHKASCKAKLDRIIRKPLELLHMDLFGHVSIESINKKRYCLVVTDDFSIFSWVFFLATKNETSEILCNLIIGLEKQLNHNVKIIRCDNGTEFKNYVMNEFCAKKGIKREFSVARTPQQNGVAERKNRTLIEAARTMLADSLLPIPFWAEAVNTACYVNVDADTQDSYVAGSSGKDKRPTQEYIPLPLQHHRTRFPVKDVVQDAQAQPSENASPDKDIQDSEDVIDKERQHLMPEDEQVWQDELEMMVTQELVANAMNDESRQAFEEEKRRIASQKKAAQATSTNQLSTDRPFVSTDRSFVSTDRSNTPNVSAASTSTGANADESSFVYLGGKIPIDASTLPNADLPIDPNMPDLEDASDTLPNDGIFNGAYDDDEDVGAVADFNNMDNTIAVSPIPTLRIHKDHPKGQILGDPTSAVQIRGKIQKASSAQQALVKEPKTISQALKDESWVEAMQEELLQFKLQQVWILVDLPFGKKAISTKWVFRNKRDERSIVVKNKARLVAQGNRQEEGIEYDEVFAPVARIEAIRLFLAFASYMGFLVYQMDVKSAFLYGTIEERFYVDDIIFVSSKKSMCTEFEEVMHKRFQISSIGKLTFFLGLQVKQQPNGIFISQNKYVAGILKKFDFCSIKTATTPIELNKPLVKDENGVEVDVHEYRSMVGSLMYLTALRPYIMFAVYACARFQVTPKASHLHTVKRIFRYLKHQPKLGLWYPRDSPFELEAFSDSDYAGASLDRKSTTEYVAAAHCCGQVLWIQNQMMDYGFNFMNTKIHIDNESTICIVKNPVYHSRTKHIEIRHHFIRDCYEKRLIDILKIHTD
ncbi:putative ribonuclease H-like domain-containing protein [Tanacetum coccineum]